jgi:predicted dehydrogenase
MEKVRYGVIGIKGKGKLHARLASQDNRVELTSLVDVDREALDQTAAGFGVRGFTDYRKMLDSGTVDAVSIATPHYLNGPIGLDCLKAGVHVFIEKPFAIRVSEADAMLAAARAKNLKICVGFQYRTYRSSRAIKELIDTGAIGKLNRVLWTWGEFRPESYYARDAWRETYRHAGGGVLMNQTSHDLDLICWLAGKPVQVSALAGNQLHRAEIEDVACANVLFANGAFGSMQLTINQPRGYSVRQIAGDKGIIVLPDVKSLTHDREDQILLGTYEDTLSKLVTDLPGNHDQPAVAWKEVQSGEKPFWKKLFDPQKVLQKLGLLEKAKVVDGTLVLMDSFVGSILEGGEPLINGESARQSLELINAILLSAARKKTVDLPIDPEEYDHLFRELCEQTTRIRRFH